MSDQISSDRGMVTQARWYCQWTATDTRRREEMPRWEQVMNVCVGIGAVLLLLLAVVFTVALFFFAFF